MPSQDKPFVIPNIDSDNDRPSFRRHEVTNKTHTPSQDVTFVIATRIHLGKASEPPAQEKLEKTISTYLHTVNSSKAVRAAIAVDPAPKIPNYDLPAAVGRALLSITEKLNSTTTKLSNMPIIPVDVVEVSPWGNFVPALNALVAWACRDTTTKSVAAVSSSSRRILFLSAETQLSSDAIDELVSRVCGSTIVAGAALTGHDYYGEIGTGGQGKRVELNGRTTPWNTAAVWNLDKLSLTGFPLVGEGLHRNEDGSTVPSGVEEVSTIALLQKMLPVGTAEAKLVELASVEWEQRWDDEERQKWHETKMESKVTRAAKHLKLLGLSGTVLHC